MLVCMRIYWQSDVLLAIRYLVDWETILIGFGLCETLLAMFLMGKATIKKTASDIVLSEKLLSKFLKADMHSNITQHYPYFVRYRQDVLF